MPENIGIFHDFLVYRTFANGFTGSKTHWGYELTEKYKVFSVTHMLQIRCNAYVAKSLTPLEKQI